MNKKLKQTLGLIKLELDKSFPVPILECIIILPLLLASYVVLQFTPGLSTRSDLVPSLYDLDKIMDTMNTLGTKKFAEVLYPINTIILFIVPVLIAFSISRELETGMTRTMLSYPIKRWYYILIKVLMLVTIIVIGVGAGLTFAVSTLIPYGANTDALLVMFLSFLVLVIAVTATTSLIAVFSKNILATTVLGCGLWFGLFFLAIYSDYDPVTRGILNPVLMAISFAGEGAIYPWFSDIVIQDVFVSIGGTLAVGLTALIIAVLQFNRMGV